METNHYVKNEGSTINGSQDIEQKRSVMADGLPDGRTDRAKIICLPQVVGRHNNAPNGGSGKKIRKENCICGRFHC